MANKYYLGRSIVDWFRDPTKSVVNASIGWKEMVDCIPLIGNWLSWKIGNDKSVCLGEDP
jgi:hypothetical protein